MRRSYSLSVESNRVNEYAWSPVSRLNCSRCSRRNQDCMLCLSLGTQDWDRGKLFSLQDQINHKVDFIKQEFQSIGPPVILVIHFMCFHQFFHFFAGVLPARVSSALVRRILGHSWSSTAVGSTCSHLLQFSEAPDLSFMKKRQDQSALLYGIDDHWGPLSVFEEISRQVPGVALSLEEEGHTDAFCCTNAGSIWVARHIANLIRSQIPY